LYFYLSQSTAVRAATPAASRNAFALTALIGATSLAYATSNCASSSAAASLVGKSKTSSRVALRCVGFEDLGKLAMKESSRHMM
jgi:hypothetical protein